jgi:2-keto-4-pentenoate hydratase/2-oxohepta-3-ene-1,7-dioic acid hydratase in catechol pathway
MKLVTYRDRSGAERSGALYAGDARIADLAAGYQSLAGVGAPALSSLQSLIEGGSLALDLARRALDHVANAEEPGTWVEREAVHLLAPLPRPVQMRDFMCFEQHLKQSFQSSMELVAALAPDPEQALQGLRASGRFDIPAIWYEIPIYYKCNRFSVSGPDQDVRWPAYANLLDYELELAAVIGTGGVDIPVEKAGDHIFGFTIFNDVSARDYQTREMQGMLGPCKGKDFDTGNLLGPCLVTAEEIDPYDLTMVARVNGEEWSRGHSGTIHHRFEACIAHVSQSETLHPGEILGSGTVGGGCGLEQKRFLSPGDVVELEIEGIGVLRNRIVKEE